MSDQLRKDGTGDDRDVRLESRETVEMQKGWEGGRDACACKRKLR